MADPTREDRGGDEGLRDVVHNGTLDPSRGKDKEKRDREEAAQKKKLEAEMQEKGYWIAKSTAELKQLLRENGISVQGCFERGDFLEVAELHRGALLAAAKPNPKGAPKKKPA